MREANEISDKRDEVHENSDSKYPGMTYEQGIADALDWVLDADSEDLEV